MCGPPVVDNFTKIEPAEKVPVEKLLQPPSIIARYTCASIFLAIFAVWGKLAFLPESEAPGVGAPIHSVKVPLSLTVFYIVSLPILRALTTRFLSKNVDVKLLLRESMFLYNAFQVLINGWMVYRFVDALLFKGHPFIGDFYNVGSGAAYAVWVHYCDKYLEFLDTYFMVLRGRMDQVSFLHVYHHVSIAWAWWYAMGHMPGGDSYFGALLNSVIHVLMYSYYALALLKIPCPWKKYITQAQLAQFLTVLVYTGCSYILVKDDGADWKFLSCYHVQSFEMISLFMLFMHFYNKAYKQKKLSKRNLSKKSSDSPDLGSISSSSTHSQ
mmetsp:Transcript_21994/g.32487  ORF Transcript_21994/g.32487 Transcript_21994/m.32487 type:complete len:326 (-) Transcript_21994:34-1011(-)